MTGDVGLDREVVAPAVLRSRAPALDSLSGGEFALVATETIRLIDERLTLAQVVEGLAGRGVAAIGVVGDVDSLAIATAVKHQLPLIHLPGSTSIYEVEQHLARVIVQQRSALYTFGLDLQGRLAELSVAGRGMSALLACLAESTDCVALLLGADHHIVDAAVPRGSDALADDLEEIVAHLAPSSTATRQAKRFGGDPAVVEQQVRSWRVIYTPVHVHECGVNVIALAGAAEVVGDIQRVALSRARVICQMELAKQEAVVETEQRLRSDLVADLVDGPEEATDLVLARAQRLGYDLRHPLVVLVAVVASHGQDEADGNEALRIALKVIREHRSDVPSALRGTSLVAVIPLRDPGDERPAHEVADLLLMDRRIRDRLTLGLGRVQMSLTGVRISFHEAEQAAVVGGKIFEAGRLVHFSDLGAYRLLLPLAGSPELQTYHDETLGPLIEYDLRNGTELLRTLDTYFARGANLKETADALFLHRNSLAYRLRRISELTGYDLDNFEDRFRLQLALKARQLLSLNGVLRSAVIARVK